MFLKEKCYACGSEIGFLIDDSYTLFREAQCKNCGASIRNSDLCKYMVKETLQRDASLKEVAYKLKSYRILNAASYGPIHDIFRNFKNYYFFEYFPDVAIGQYKNGIQCNDLRNLSYKNDYFDIVITEDVFEHIDNPIRAFQEIARVLKTGGFHIFSIPFHSGRLSLNRVGLPKVYHEDPNNPEGSLVYTDWGDDIFNYIDENCPTITTMRVGHFFYEGTDLTNVDKSYEEYLRLDALKYYKYNSYIFISKKIGQKKTIRRLMKWLTPNRENS